LVKHTKPIGKALIKGKRQLGLGMLNLVFLFIGACIPFRHGPRTPMPTDLADADNLEKLKKKKK
jgi:hypothetical protein